MGDLRPEDLTNEMICDVERDAIGQLYVDCLCATTGQPEDTETRWRWAVVRRLARERICAAINAGTHQINKHDAQIALRCGRSVLQEIRRFVATATDWSDYPSPLQAAAEMPHVHRWLSLLDHLTDVGKP